MTREHSLKYLLPALALLPGATTTAAAERHPNVLLILTDDQGWGDVHANGNPLIHTPTMDRLHDESVVLENFYVSPLSAPTRASLLTGRYHLATGVCSVQSGLENMNPEETTLAELFREAGYATGCFGKWHNGTYYPYTPNGQGFDEFLGFCCGHWANYFDPLLQHNETMFRGKGYITDIFTDAALEFIDEHKDGPFFCYVPYNAPHSPFQVPDAYYDKYREIEAANDKDRRTLASIYAMVECVDANIARLLDRLDSLGIREQTIVLFMTDNGPVHVVRYNGGMRGMKGSVHEGGVHTPCYINWQGTLRHRSIEPPTAHIDILPTLMDLCGIRNWKTAFPVDGQSLAACVRGEGEAPRGRMIFTHRMLQEMHPWMGGVRTDRYRMTIYPGDEVMLYDLAEDPAEERDIYDAENPEHRRIRDAYHAWYGRVVRGVNPDPTVPVGYAEAPQVRIPTPEGRMYGALKCYGYPNQNWVNHFREACDSLSFTLHVVTEGDYGVELEYNHLGENAASQAVVECAGQHIAAHVPAFESHRTYAPDRVERDEAYEQTWGSLAVGRLHLRPGRHVLTLWAEHIPQPTTMQVKTVILNRLDHE